MSTLSRKVTSVALAATTAVWLSGALLVVPVASAQTSSDLQAQINALLSQISQLQAQLATKGGASTSGTSFTRDLTVGSRGTDVSALQQTLINDGFLTAVSAPTGYFGPATKKAVKAWQASMGLPSTGYFGPLSRAQMNSAMAGGGTTGGGTTGGGTTGGGTTGGGTAGGGTTGGGTTGGGVVAPSTGLQVSLAANTPATGALISSSGSAAARVPVLAVNLTAGTAGGVTVTALNFHKVGVLSDSSIAGAYLVEKGKVLYQYNSVNQGVIGFSGLSLGVNAGQTRTIFLAIDPTVGLSAGNTVSFSLNGPNDINSYDSSNNLITETGNFPVTGNVFTVTSVSNPSIAALTVASSSVGSTVYAGTQNVLVSQWTLTGTNSPVNLTSINFKIIGSANKTDIKNVKLLINGTQVGSTLPSVGSDGSAYFDLSASPAKVNTGSSNMQVVADIMGSPSFNFQFEVLNSYDVYAVDTQYNVPVAVTVNGGSGVQVTIQQGQITVTVDTGTPTSNIAKGGSGTTLAKFDIYAAGEPVRVKFLDVTLTQTTSTGDNSWGGTTASTANTDYNIKNVMIVDDQGNQVGTTINSVGSGGSSSGQCTITSGTVLTCHFGTSSSNISYVVPANTTRVLSVKGDIQTTAAFSTLTAALASESSNLQGLTSSQTASSGSANGSTLTLASNSLTVTKNAAFANQNYAKGSTGVKVGSYVLTASSAEGVNVSNFTVSLNSSSTSFQNLTAKVGSTVIGTVYPTLSATNFTFSGAITVPVGGTQIVDLYADVLNSASGSAGTLTSWVSCTGTGQMTFASVSCSGTPSGQSITVAGTLTLTVSNNNSLASRQVVMGNTNVSLAKLLLQDTTGIEPLRVQEVKFTVTAGSSVGQGFQNLKLYDASGNFIQGAGPISMTSVAPNYVADFNFGSAQSVVVPSGQNLALELRGDVPAFTASSSVENATSAISIGRTVDVVAFGKSSNLSVTVTGTPSFSTLTALRSKLNLAGAVLATDAACGNFTGGAATNRSRTAVDYLSCLKFSADSSGQDVRVNTLTLTFSGAAASMSTTFGVQLIDPQTQTNYDGSSNSVTCNPAPGGNSCSVSFAFNATPISAGQTKGVAVQVVSTNFASNAVAGKYAGLDLTLGASSNVNWGDGSASIGANPTGLSLSSDVSTPLLLTHADYQ